MYNRYIPQADGSFQRHPFPDAQPQHQATAPAAKPEPKKEEPCQSPQPDSIPLSGSRCTHCPMRHRRCTKAKTAGSSGINGFLSQLLPDDFDTGDVMVILLLLLMSADRSEDQSTALLTLALYLFL